MITGPKIIKHFSEVLLTYISLVPIETWCNDDPVCGKYTEASCNEAWLKVNCPKKCKICGNGEHCINFCIFVLGKVISMKEKIKLNFVVGERP